MCAYVSMCVKTHLPAHAQLLPGVQVFVYYEGKGVGDQDVALVWKTWALRSYCSGSLWLRRW